MESSWQKKVGTQTISHVRGDSDSEVDAHIKMSLYPGKKQVPMKDRNLPESFFKPPETGSRSGNHSRESSTDSTRNALMRPAPPGLVPSHSRAHSSPASLQQSQLSPAPPVGTHPHPNSLHMRQHSEIPDHIHLPPGWEAATTPTGQRYFINHIAKTTTWEDPRIKYFPQQMQNAASLETLPEGWEQASTPDGETYYINHNERTTSWSHPRIASFLSSQQRQQNMRLHSLQQERERLRQRTQEIYRQGGTAGQNRTTGAVHNQPQDMMLRGSHMAGEERSSTTNTTMTGVDPFLGGGEYHARQESTDSGLELGTNYSLPRTPDDFLGSNVDEMEATDGSQQNQQHSRVPDFLDSMQGTNVDMGGMDSNSGTTNMDTSDELVPSLDIGTDILGDVAAVLNNNKIDNLLTWL